jgi:transcriptional regulator with XRE-family HTH domain
MPTGKTQLKDWIARRGLDQRQAAELLGFHEAFVSQLVNGRRSPGLNNAVIIERLTGIPVSAWATSRVDRLTATVPVNTRKRTA